MAPPTATETVSTIKMQAPQSQEAGADKAKVKMQMPAMPTFTDKMEERHYLKGRLAAAFRIFGKYGFDEGKRSAPKAPITQPRCDAILTRKIYRRGRPHHPARPRRPKHVLGESLRHSVLAH